MFQKIESINEYRNLIFHCEKSKKQMELIIVKQVIFAIDLFVKRAHESSLFTAFCSLKTINDLSVFPGNCLIQDNSI